MELLILVGVVTLIFVMWVIVKPTPDEESRVGTREPDNGNRSDRKGS